MENHGRSVNEDNNLNYYHIKSGLKVPMPEFNDDLFVRTFGAKHGLNISLHDEDKSSPVNKKGTPQDKMDLQLMTYESHIGAHPVSMGKGSLGANSAISRLKQLREKAADLGRR
jgi:hypothetical protein